MTRFLGAPRRPRRGAFTLVEIVVTIIVVGLLAALAALKLSGALDASRETQSKDVLRRVGQAALAQQQSAGGGALSAVTDSTDGDYRRTQDTGAASYSTGEHSLSWTTVGTGATQRMGMAIRYSGSSCAYGLVGPTGVVSTWSRAGVADGDCDGETAALTSDPNKLVELSGPFTVAAGHGATISTTTVAWAPPKFLQVYNRGDATVANDLRAAGFTVDTNTNAHTTADLAGYDAAIADSYAWAFDSGTASLLSAAYTTGTSVLSIGNDNNTGTLPQVSAVVGKDTATPAYSWTPAAPGDPLGQYVQSFTGETDTGQLPSALRPGATALATMVFPVKQADGTRVNTTGVTVYSEEEPGQAIAPARWVHSQAFESTAGAYTQLIAHAGAWLRPTDVVSPGYDLGKVGAVASSRITFAASTPAGTSAKVFTSLDGGATWSPATSGQPVPGLATGTATAGMRLVVRVMLEGAPGPAIPHVDDLHVIVTG